MELVPGDFRIVIEASAGDGDEGDIAIDGISVVAKRCNVLSEETFKKTAKAVSLGNIYLRLCCHLVAGCYTQPVLKCKLFVLYIKAFS